jgi:GTPase
MPTYEEALDYLGIDYADDVVKRNVNRAMATAAKTLQGAVGADVLTLMPNDERVKELGLIYTDDLYSTRGVAAKVSGATRQLVHTMEQQLRLELRQLRKEAAGV